MLLWFPVTAFTVGFKASRRWRAYVVFRSKHARICTGASLQQTEGKWSRWAGLLGSPSALQAVIKQQAGGWIDRLTDISADSVHSSALHTVNSRDTQKKRHSKKIIKGVKVFVTTTPSHYTDDDRFGAVLSTLLNPSKGPNWFISIARFVQSKV